MRSTFAVTVLLGFSIASVSRATTDPPPYDYPYGSQQGVALQGGWVERQHDRERLTFTLASARAPDGSMLSATYLDPSPGAETELVGSDGITEFRGGALQGVTFNGVTSDGNMYIATIMSYRPYFDLAGRQLAEYHVTLDNGEDLCPWSMPTDGAMPIEGYWSPDGQHRSDPTRFHFACSDGVIFKCVNWGYRPWDTPSGTTIAGQINPPVTGIQLHQTCTRMARADYCADGYSRTMNGTWIQQYDIFNTTMMDLVGSNPLPNVHSHPLHPSDDRTWWMYLEAAWRPGSNDEGREETAAICLSKKRWTTIPLEPDFCLPDPRKSSKEDVHFCEDTAFSEAVYEIQQHALLFNDSAFVDLGLYRWSPPLGPDYYTTSHYPDLGILTTISPSPAFPALPPPPAMPRPSFEGAVFNYATNFVPDPSALINLCTYQGILNPIYLTTTSTNDNCLPAPAGFQLVPPDPDNPDPREGKVYDPAMPTHIPPTAVPLYLYFDFVNQHYITTSDDTIGLPGNVIGYLPRR